MGEFVVENAGSINFPSFGHYTCVPQGNGIRGSKDLRARARKFLTLTNERKQMSTKTIKQRIALVAVSALTAGLFSVVSAPAANATSTGYGTNVAAATGTNPALAVSNTLYIASAPSLSGSAVVISAPTTPAALGSAETSAARSLGLINVSDLAGGLTAGTTTTATLLSTGSISVYAQAVSDKGSTIVVTGGTITATGITAASQGAISGSNTAAAYGLDGALTAFGAVVKPNSGVSSMTIQLYSGYALTTTPATDWTALLANPTGATGLALEGQITVTIASASVAGVADLAKSGIYGDSNGTVQTGANALTADDTSFVGQSPFNVAQYMQVRVRDAFGNGITSTAGLLQVTATNGALVNAETGTVAAAGTASTDFITAAKPDEVMVQIDAPSNAPVVTTVTASWNGTVVGSKTIRFTGKVAKMELSGAVIGSNGASITTNYVYYKLFDAAGNATYNIYTGSSAFTAYPYSTVGVNAAAVTGLATGLTKNREFSISASTAAVTSGRAYFTCTLGGAGAGTIGMSFTNLDGSIVNSNTLGVNCAGDAVTYKASWDKASYIPGDLATLTVTGYDSKGNVANDIGTIADSNSAASIPVVAIGGLDKNITVPTTGDVLDQGTIKYKYTVGATEGTYSGKVSFPTIDARYASNVSSAGADAVTTTLVVKAGTAAVSNADVLKSIVALIASINKQIQALQKLILKR